MATYTDNGTNTPNGSHKVFTYTFPALQTEDIKVALNGIVQATTKYTASLSPAQIEFNATSTDATVQNTSTGAPLTGVQVRVFRETTVGKNSGDEDPKAVFAAGSSIRAADLNANQEQALFAIHELQTQPVKTSDIEPDAVTNSKIVDNAIDSEHYVDGSIDRVHLAPDIVDGTKIADNSIDSEHYVDGSIDVEHLADNSVDRASIVNDAVNGDKIADDSINSEHYVDASIDEQHIANSAVTSNKIADNAVTTSEILNGAVTRAKLEDDIIDGTKLADNAVDSEHYTDGSIERVHLEADIIDSTKLADNAVNSEHYVNDSIDTQHIADGQITEPKLAVNSVNTGKIVDGTVNTNKIANDAVTIDKIADAVIVTNSEQASHSVDDNTFFTTSAAEARYFNASTGETIKDGQAFPDNDTTIATTAAINDRIIDLVDDVGGFVPIANETSFPTSNPDVNDGSGTIVSVSAASTNLVPSGTTVTIANGRGSGLAVIITGVSATIPQGYGFLVETTTTDHTYSFHRLVPKATEVTTVAGKATEIGRLGTADAVADMAILGTADVVSDLNTLGTADVVADMNMLATSDVISDMNTLAVTDVINDMDTVATNVTNVNNVGGSISNVNTTAGSIANVNTVAGSISNVNTTAGSIANVNTTAGSIANVNTVATNINNVNDFFDKYRVGANNPTSSLDTGDLFFNTTSNSLKVYTGSAWVDGVTTTGNFALKTGNTFTGSNIYNDNVKALFGTGSDLQIHHDGTNSFIDNTTGIFLIRNNDEQIRIRPKGPVGGTNEESAIFKPNAAVELYYDNSKKLNTAGFGVKILGDVDIEDADPKLYLTATSARDYYFHNDAGTFKLRDEDASNAVRYQLGGDGIHYIYGNTNVMGTSDLTVVGGDLKLTADNKKLQIGAGQDLQIYHDGTNNYIEGNNQKTIIRNTSNNIHIQAKSGEAGIDVLPNGAVKLYYDGSELFRTESGGAVVSGNLRLPFDGHQLIMGAAQDLKIKHDGTNNDINYSGGNLLIRQGTHTSSQCLQFDGNGHLYVPDNEKIYFGASADLQIYHSGNHSYIKDAGTGNLIVASSQMQIINAAEDEMMARFDQNGAVELYYDSNKKFDTTSTGARVTGRLTTDGVHIGDGGNNDTSLSIGANNDLRLYHDGSNSYIKDRGTGNLYITGDDTLFIQSASGEDKLKATTNGSVEIYYDNVKHFDTKSGGVATYGGSSSVAIDLRMSDSSVKGYVYANSSNQVGFLHYDGNWSALFNRGGDSYLYSNLRPSPDATYSLGATTHRWHSVHATNFYGNGSNLTGINTDLVSDTTPQLGGDLDINNYNVLFSDSTNANNDRIKFGAGEDLQIYHDGTYNKIAADSSLFLQNKAANEAYLAAYENGAVELYYDNSIKLITQSNGIQINGSSSGSPLILTGAMGTTESFKIANTTSGGYIQIGLQQNDSDGLHHRAYLRAQKGGANIAGKLEIVARGSGGGTDRGFTIDAASDIQSNLTFRPSANNTYDLGTSSNRWRNVYTNDLNLSNKGSSNDVDGSWGDWTIQEGESDLFLKNNRSGKKYKFNLMEVS